tara:strand:+ start:6402 stop:7256 length:855 start_codon:yes stop_codon:yes gene_type:complete
MLFLLMPNFVYATDDLEKKFKVFTKVTNNIKKKFDSLAPGNSPEAIIIDAAIQEMDKVMEFFGESFKNNNIEVAEMTLIYIDKSLSDINKLVPKEFINDLSGVDMNSLPEKDLQKIMQTTKQMQINKKEKLTSLVKYMTKIDQKGLNLFQISNNLNDLGVKTLNFQEIAKAVSSDSSLKTEVLKSAKEMIEPESLGGELKNMQDVTSNITMATSEIADITLSMEGLSSEVQEAATELGIAEATAAAAAAAGVDISEHMPTLDTMQQPGFDAEAHNRAMQEIQNK